MLAPTKKPLTKTSSASTPFVELRVVGPPDRCKAAETALKQLGFTIEPTAVPWREAFAELGSPDLVGRILRGTRHKEGLTQVELSRKTGIPQRHLSEMEHDKRPIGKKAAQVLAQALNVDYKLFL
jgi:ribosome-binding protein aMBF1 (putative translation factor)